MVGLVGGDGDGEVAVRQEEIKLLLEHGRSVRNGKSHIRGQKDGY